MNRSRQEPKLGLRTCSLSRAGSFDTQTLGRLKEAGFDLVELSFNPRSSIPASWEIYGTPKVYSRCGGEHGRG